MGETVEQDGIVYSVKKTYNPKTGGIAKTLVPVGKVEAPAAGQPDEQAASADPDAKPAKTGKVASVKAKVKRRKKK